METAFISLGSNLDNPIKHVLDASHEINQLNNITVTRLSSIYKTKPIGPQKQNDFINAVAVLRTSLSPIDLLSLLQSIEEKHSRKRSIRWGPRSLDLDILQYGKLVISTKDLKIPHPELVNREFVLIPLLEVTNPDFIITKHGKIKKYL